MRKFLKNLFDQSQSKYKIIESITKPLELLMVVWWRMVDEMMLVKFTASRAEWKMLTLMRLGAVGSARKAGTRFNVLSTP